MLYYTKLRDSYNKPKLSLPISPNSSADNSGAANPRNSCETSGPVDDASAPDQLYQTDYNQKTINAKPDNGIQMTSQLSTLHQGIPTGIEQHHGMLLILNYGQKGSVQYIPLQLLQAFQ